jgi:hypothetical protein
MIMLIQTIAVIAVVAASLIYLLVQLSSALAGRRSKLGSCCAKGCEPAAPSPTPRTAFIPSELLIRRK